MPYRSLVEALYTLNSPPVVSFNRGSGLEPRGEVGCSHTLQAIRLTLTPTPQHLDSWTLSPRP